MSITEGNKEGVQPGTLGRNFSRDPREHYLQDCSAKASLLKGRTTHDGIGCAISIINQETASRDEPQRPGS